MLQWLSGFKTYAYGAIATAFAAMMIYIKYQSTRLTAQAKELARREKQIAVVEEYHKDKDKVQDYEVGNGIDHAKTEAGDVEDTTTGTHTI